MRDPKRLQTLYHFLEGQHEMNVPDWRMGQFMVNFMSWYVRKYGCDPYYLPDTKFLEVIDDFLKENM